jgi:hypothetical protein
MVNVVFFLAVCFATCLVYSGEPRCIQLAHYPPLVRSAPGRPSDGRKGCATRGAMTVEPWTVTSHEYLGFAPRGDGRVPRVSLGLLLLRTAMDSLRENLVICAKGEGLLKVARECVEQAVLK